MIHILLAEDSDSDAFLIQEALKQAKFENTLHHCWNGEEAQDFLENEDNPLPDLIFLDLNMPLMNGHEILKWIKLHEDFKDIPIGILTTSSAENDINESYKNYASYYIVKPKNFADLQDVVKLIDDFWVQTVKRPHHI